MIRGQIVFAFAFARRNTSAKITAWGKWGTPEGCTGGVLVQISSLFVADPFTYRHLDDTRGRTCEQEWIRA